ncbi:cathepsin O-like isoform X2 [Tachypleus tridentatus]|uniref:cathepsin O-like isoform X2 n=1 Tax=Tachypleus tridentatus TaxID=6853 RepID=UPI003FD6A619
MNCISRNCIVIVNAYLILTFFSILGVTEFVTSDRFVIDDLFNNFVRTYNKSYSPGSLQYFKRLSIFKASLERIEWLNKHRKNNNSALYGITEFSDLTPSEFQQFILRKRDVNSNFHKYNKNSKLRWKRSLSDIPKYWDWAFSTVETIETMYALKSGILKELSVQQLIDCATGKNQGCDGGDTCAALIWLDKYNVSVVTEAQYPLKNVAQPCKLKNPKKGIQITSDFSCDNFTGNEVEMLQLVYQQGPIIAAVDATGWQDYLGGVIQFNCETDKNHAVQIVGFDQTSAVPYYIVRNSWGTKFGVDGYLKIAVGKNLCGIAEEVSYLNIL